MYNLRLANGFQGVDLVLSESELNAVVAQCDRLIAKFRNSDELAETIDKLHSLKNVLTKFSYYDENEREVHCRMGFYELQLLLECTIVALPEGKENVFEKMLKNEKTKRWVYKAQEENKFDV